MTNKKNIILIVLLLLSIGMGAVEAIMNSQGETISETTQTFWGFIFIVLTILWAIHDAKASHFEKPFDFDFLMYVFWPIAFPYYLLSTRGLEGILIFIGFLTLWCGPWLAGLAAYVYIYGG